MRENDSFDKLKMGKKSKKPGLMKASDYTDQPMMENKRDIQKTIKILEGRSKMKSSQEGGLYSSVHESNESMPQMKSDFVIANTQAFNF